VADSYCTASKPASSQTCSTACTGSNSQQCNSQACAARCSSSWQDYYSSWGNSVLNTDTGTGSLSAAKSACAALCNNSTARSCYVIKVSGQSTFTCVGKTEALSTYYPTLELSGINCN